MLLEARGPESPATSGDPCPCSLESPPCRCGGRATTDWDRGMVELRIVPNLQPRAIQPEELLLPYLS
jgi:hypothetical protein